MTEITRRVALVASAAALALSGVATAQEPEMVTWRFRSPRGRTEVELRWNREGSAQYRALLRTHDGRLRVAVDWSALGIVTQLYNTFDMHEPLISDFTAFISFVGVESSDREDAYTLVTGKRRENRAAYKQLSVTFRHEQSHRLLRIDLRAYDEGVAFRYVLPETSPMPHWMVSEKTEFAMGLGGRHWGQAYDFFTMYHPSYETVFDVLPTGTATPPNAGTGWGFPSLFEREGAFALIHETGLDANFHGSHLQADCSGGRYKIAPPMREESLGFGANFPVSTLPWEMPWRMIALSDTLADIVESNLVFHLAQPSRIADASWVKPGLASWNWASDHDSGLHQDRLRGYIDLAADMGWPYSLIDANWNLSGAHALEDLVAYANSKNVALLFWYNSGGRHNVVTEQPRNIMDDRARRRAEIARLSALGVKGVKVDFFQSDKQDVIRQYLEILEDAADFHLMADFHGCTIPRGWQRTWPNLISMEAVRGAEFYSFPSEPDYGAIAPRLNTIHPFIRNVVGSMDYTPVLFSHLVVNRRTTNAHEAALAVVFESGIQHFADSPVSYRSLPADWRAYLSAVPAAWDETRLIEGAPGRYVVIARRSGARWWVAGINGEAETKQIDFALSRLPGARGGALVLFDDAAGGYPSRHRATSDGAHVRETMRGFGGFVMVCE